MTSTPKKPAAAPGKDAAAPGVRRHSTKGKGGRPKKELPQPREETIGFRLLLAGPGAKELARAVASDPSRRGDWEELRAARLEFNEVYAAAATVKAVEVLSFEKLLERANATFELGAETVVDRLDASTKPGIRAALGLQQLALQLADAERDAFLGGEEWRLPVRQLRRDIAYLRGYIDGFYRAGAAQSARAASSRRPTGEMTEERIRTLAEPFRRAGQTKGHAANEIASDAGRSETYLLKKLSQLFPGGTWKWPKSGH